MAITAVRPWLQVYDAAGQSAESIRTCVGNAFREPSVTALRVVNAAPSGDVLAFWAGVGSRLGSGFAINPDYAVDVVKHGATDWMDVRYDPKAQHTYRHAKAAQPLHTDSAHVATPPGIALMVMEKQAPSGGETVLVDVATIARIAAEREPGLFAKMTGLPVNMALAPGRGSHEPVLRKAGDRWSMRWNYYRVAADQGAEVASFCEELQAFLIRLAASDCAEVFRLDEGDALILNDGGVLHGRLAFAAETQSERLMWKTYFAAAPSLM